MFFFRLMKCAIMALSKICVFIISPCSCTDIQTSSFGRWLALSPIFDLLCSGWMKFPYHLFLLSFKEISTVLSIIFRTCYLIKSPYILWYSEHPSVEQVIRLWVCNVRSFIWKSTARNQLFPCFFISYQSMKTDTIRLTIFS